MPYGQKYSLEYWKKDTYSNLLYTYKAKIFQQGYVTGGGIILSPAQVESSTDLNVGGITLDSTDGLITFPWTATLQALYGEYPLVWTYYDGQIQPITPQLDDTDTPTEITIDIGTVPSTNLILIFKKADTETQYTIAVLTLTSGVITVSISAFQLFWIYYDDQIQPIVPVYNHNDTPTSVSIDLGTIPATNAYLGQYTPDADLTYTEAEITTSGGVITIPDTTIYGTYPKFYVVYDSQIQFASIELTPTTAIIDLGTIPAGNTHVLVVNGGDAVGIQELIPATETPISINGIQGDPRQKMQALKGSDAVLRVIANADFDIEDIYTDSETEYYAEFSIEKPDDTFTIYWSNDNTNGECQLAIGIDGVTVLNTSAVGSGTFTATRGALITGVAFTTGGSWPTPQTGIQLEFTGKPTLRDIIIPNGIAYNNVPIEYDIHITAYSTDTAPDYQAIRSEIFYNATSNYPVAFTKSYTAASQIDADAAALADSDYYIEGQNYADSWPIGFPAWWRGFLVIDAGSSQAYQTVSIVELSFVDGIGLLKNLLFVDNGGNYFLNKLNPKDIFYNCLYRLGIPDMNIYIRSELFETSFDTGRDPMVQVLHQAETYFLSTQTKPLDMGQVMESVLSNYGLEIRQNLGEWWITQIDTLYTAGEGTWFKYSWVTGTELTTVEKDWTVTLGLSRGVFDTIFALADQRKVLDRAYRGQIVKYEFKSAQNINQNPTLVPTADGSGWLWDGWTVDPLGSVQVGPGVDGTGARMESNALRPADPPVLKMTSENIAVEADDMMVFNLGFTNTTDVVFGQFQVKFTNGVDTYYLNEDGSWTLTTPVTIYKYNGQALVNELIGPTDFYLWALDTDLAVEIIAEAIPGGVAGNVNIILYNYDYSLNNSFNAAEVNSPDYNNFAGTTTWILAKASFAVPVTDTAQVAQGTFYIAANIGNPTYTPPILTVLNADDQTSRYVGTLYREDETTPTTFWSRLDSIYELKPLLWIIAEMYVRMYQKPFRICTATIYGIYPQLSRFTIDGWEGVYMNAGTDHQLGSNLHNANLIQISNVDISGAPTTIEETDYGQYDNGDLPVIII